MDELEELIKELSKPLENKPPQKCIWDNCQTIHITPMEVKELILAYAQSRLTNQQQNELIVGRIEQSHHGFCKDFHGISLKVFFCEPEFKEQAKKC